MELSFYILCLSIATLVATSLIFGLKFLGKRNYLLGFEWLVVTFSASNFLLYFLGGVEFSYRISYFLDAFSRGFGIPVIATAGLMAVTHRYKPSILSDVLFFAAAIAATAVLVSADFMAQPRPYFYVAMWSAFSVYLAYFAWRLLSAGEGLLALGVLVVLLTSQAIATIYDFYKIPGDDEQALFYVLACLAWSLMCVVMYYAYGALERAEKNEASLSSMLAAR
ncbi:MULTISPECIES: hypothetical protein [Cupriavidus]|jgi:hypothetical protein|uniref:Membrane protein n=1 Tax=Cupriavidus neocaledonicus TaxID=1040979 RepID=A0A375HMA4_9BURK|nr:MULTISPECIES: hypothetical protein [Cupriavidus]QUN32329.1 hypothetical protein KB879_31950 [Cupriavidus sp. KK10]SOZ40960.1 Membrane protein [Cupriavidus neocaledonicus]SPD59012.1 Membrane protein [Cupriavidus neocaledonicus]